VVQDHASDEDATCAWRGAYVSHEGNVAPDHRMQICAEFLIDSIEVLERLANKKKPPMRLEAIERKRNEFVRAKSNATSELKTALAPMATAFRGRGDVGLWDYRLLEKIDKCFKDHYNGPAGLARTLFFPDNAENQNRYLRYCVDVDHIFQENSAISPPFAREYFAFYSIWQMQGLRFPLPLGTASVIDALDKLLTKYRLGVCEVSSIFVMHYNTDTFAGSHLDGGVHNVAPNGQGEKISYPRPVRLCDHSDKE
jgi:hypothetical protein